MFEMKKAERTGTPPIIIVWSVSGGGKTLSSLLMARGIVGPKGKIGLIDTEHNRALDFADAEGVGEWHHLNFEPPFTPERYIEAINYSVEKYKIDCLIVDSASHEWEGEGGILEFADSQKYSDGKFMQGLGKWKVPKTRHKKFTNAVLRQPIPIILGLRAKSGSEQVGKGKDAKIVSTGLQPICDKDFIYEATISICIGPDHKPLFKNIGRFACNDVIARVKVPDSLKYAIKEDEFINVKTGEEIAKWIASGKKPDVQLIELQKIARDVATLGTPRLQEHWKSLSKPEQTILLSIKEDLKHIASQADEDSETQSDDEDPGSSENETDSLDDDELPV